LAPAPAGSAVPNPAAAGFEKIKSSATLVISDISEPDAARLLGAGQGREGSSPEHLLHSSADISSPSSSTTTFHVIFDLPVVSTLSTLTSQSFTHNTSSTYFTVVL